MLTKAAPMLEKSIKFSKESMLYHAMKKNRRQKKKRKITLKTMQEKIAQNLFQKLKKVQERQQMKAQFTDSKNVLNKKIGSRLQTQDM